MSLWGCDELFVSNLPDVTETEINALFGQHGHVKEVVMNIGGARRGQAAAPSSASIVRMASHGEATAAKKAMHKYEWNSKVLNVRWSHNQRVLWVGGLEETVTNEVLHAAFSQFGTVVRAIVTCDAPNNSSKCWGFVSFDNKRAAVKAIAAVSERPFCVGAGSARPVRVELARNEETLQGFTEELRQGVRGAQMPPIEAPGFFPQPHTQEHGQAVRLRELRQEYDDLKRILSDKYRQAEQHLLAGRDTPRLLASFVRDPRVAQLLPPMGGPLGGGPMGGPGQPRGPLHMGGGPGMGGLPPAALGAPGMGPPGMGPPGPHHPMMGHGGGPPNAHQLMRPPGAPPGVGGGPYGGPLSSLPPPDVRKREAEEAFHGVPPPGKRQQLIHHGQPERYNAAAVPGIKEEHSPPGHGIGSDMARQRFGPPPFVPAQGQHTAHAPPTAAQPTPQQQPQQAQPPQQQQQYASYASYYAGLASAPPQQQPQQAQQAQSYAQYMQAAAQQPQARPALAQAAPATAQPQAQPHQAAQYGTAPAAAASYAAYASAPGAPSAAGQYAAYAAQAYQAQANGQYAPPPAAAASAAAAATALASQQQQQTAPAAQQQQAPTATASYYNYNYHQPPPDTAGQAYGSTAAAPGPSAYPAAPPAGAGAAQPYAGYQPPPYTQQPSGTYAPPGYR